MSFIVFRIYLLCYIVFYLFFEIIFDGPKAQVLGSIFKAHFEPIFMDQQAPKQGPEQACSPKPNIKHCLPSPRAPGRLAFLPSAPSHAALLSPWSSLKAHVHFNYLTFLNFSHVNSVVCALQLPCKGTPHTFPSPCKDQATIICSSVHVGILHSSPTRHLQLLVCLLGLSL